MESNTIEIQLDHADSEVSVDISKCFLSNKEITTLVTLLWEYSWDVEGDFEATNNKNRHWFIFGLHYTPTVPLEVVAEELREKVQQLFPDKFVNIN